MKAREGSDSFTHLREAIKVRHKGAGQGGLEAVAVYKGLEVFTERKFSSARVWCHSALAGLEKTRVFNIKKTSRVAFSGFLCFLGFFAQKRGYLGFFSVSRILYVHPDLKL